MILVELKGGLGNQLFQYAAGLALSEFHKVPLKVDIANLKLPDETIGTYRKYVLSNLQIPPVIANEVEINSFKGNVAKKIYRFLPIQFKSIFKEKYFHFNPSFWKTKKTVYLKGNFQSDKYFNDFCESIIEKISFDGTQHSTVSKMVLEKISNSESLSIHIRRGDYVSNKIANDVLGTLPIEYYQQAYQLLSSKTSIKRSFVFSDDIKWAKQNLHFVKEVSFVETDDVNRDIEDFYLMQHCKHNIIANSSFSWWAAYLNPNPNKIVIAPERWFNKAPLNTKDLYPNTWLKV